MGYGDGVISHCEGYLRRRDLDHPRSSHGYVLEHIVVAEETIGFSLPPGAVVHHIDQNRANNNPGNLVVCEDRRYHALLHSRTESLHATGRPDMKLCPVCEEWKELQEFGVRTERSGCPPRSYCKVCEKRKS